MQESDRNEFALGSFLDEGWIAEVLFEVKSGKEATVFCCRGGPRSPVPLVAAKVYRPLESRGFRNDSRYQGGRVHMAREGRIRRAVQSKSSFGRNVQYGTWLGEEWDVLNVLYEAGAAVPQPLAVGERALLMAFVGDASGSAPMLHQVTPEPSIVARCLDEILWNIELMLHHDCVHGDLSAYNIMWHEERVVIIDFPQAIDPRLNRHGQALLLRDVANVCDWASRRGVETSAGRVAGELWHRFMCGEIG